MRGRGISFHGPVNSGEAGGHRSKPEVVQALGGVYDTSGILILGTDTIPCQIR